MKCSWVGIMTRRGHSSFMSQGKQTRLVELIQCIANQNQRRIMRKIPNPKPHLFHSILPFFPGSASHLDCLPPPCKQDRGEGNGSWGRFITYCLFCSFLLMGSALHKCCPAAAWGYCHRRQSFMKFSNVSPFHELQFPQTTPARIPSRVSPSGADWCSMDPLQGHKS